MDDDKHLFDLELRVRTPDDRLVSVKSYVDPEYFGVDTEPVMGYHFDGLKTQAMTALKEAGYFDGR